MGISGRAPDGLDSAEPTCELEADQEEEYRQDGCGLVEKVVGPVRWQRLVFCAGRGHYRFSHIGAGRVHGVASFLDGLGTVSQDSAIAGNGFPPWRSAPVT